MTLVRWFRMAGLGAALGLLVGPMSAAPARAQDKEVSKAAEGNQHRNTQEEKEKEKPKPVIAVFRLAGAVKETPTDDLFSFGPGSSTTLRSLVERMDKAAKDEAVKAVVILNEPTASFGRAQVEEVRQAMKRVQDAGKDVIAHADSLSMGQYVLLSGATRLSVSPTGDVWISGLYGEGIYLRGLLDKLHVQPDFMTCGEFKSAAEMFMRDGPSPEADKMTNWLLDSMFQTSIRLIAEGRKADPTKVHGWIDEGSYTAERAQKAGLVDAVEHRQDVEAALKTRFGADVVLNHAYGKKTLPKPDFSTPFGIMRFYGELLSGPKKPESKKPAVGIVYVEGPIVVGPRDESLFMGATASSSPLRKALEDAARDETVKAVVLRVDSPGGSAIASEIILDATRRVKAKKPFVVSMGDVAGSGGYYVACASDVIFADASTITASIGVVSGKLATEGLYDKLGIRLKGYKRGANAGMLSSGQPFTPSERKAMRQYMDEVYEVFRGHVKAIRGDRLTKPLDELAGGRVFTGQQALELGLIDKIGTLDDAIKHVASLAKLGDDYEVRTVPPPKSIIEVLMEESGGDEAKKGLLDAAERPVLLELATPLLRALDPNRAALVRTALGRLELIQREGVVLMMPELGLAP